MFNKKKIKLIILGILTLISITSTSYLIYSLSLLNGIENTIRYLFITTLIVVLVALLLTYFKALKKKDSKYFIALPFIIFYCVGMVIIANYIMRAYKALDTMTTNQTTYSSSAVVLKDNKASKIGDIKTSTIGILEDTNNVVGNEMPNEMIKKQSLTGKITKYDSYISLIKALYEEEIEVAFLPTNYEIMFGNMGEGEFADIKDKVKIIHTEKKEMKNKEINKGTSLNKPFTILLMGVDSENDELAGSSFNGDSLMLITFNPTTLSTTILSIPRDSYVPIMCFTNNRKNKITHAAAYGEECMIKTIENFTEVKVDYYVKINFKGVVNLVDSLGGVDIDVPFAFCEQNSKREWGANTIYVEKGFQTLNGEQALAYSRHREEVWSRQFCSSKWVDNGVVNDFVRGQHQQEVVRALLNKLKNMSSINTLYSVLDTISKSMQTNMTTSELLSLYNIGKDVITKSTGGDMEDLVSMQRLYLAGSDAYIYDPVYKLKLYNFVINDNSLTAVINAMKVNLGQVKAEVKKDFYFAIDEPYEEEIIGKNVKASNSLKTVPDFIGDTETEARATAAKLGLKVTFKYVDSVTGTNKVTSQSVVKGTDLSTVSSITLTITQKKEVKTESNEKESNEKESNEKESNDIEINDKESEE